MPASALQSVRTKGRWPEGKAIFDRRSISRLLMTLVALFALTTGAWAETVTWLDTDMKTSGNADFTKNGVTVTPDNSNGNAKSGNYFYSYGMNTFTTTLGNFTKIEIEFKPSSSSLTISGWDYELIEAVQPDPIDHPDSWYYTGKLTWEGNAESVSIQGNVSNIQSITFTIDPNAVPITWDNAAKTATIASMPAGNVEVNVNYFAQAELAKSTDATPVALAPAPIPGVPANTDAPIVTPGTVANIGNTTTKQGTLMYYVSEEQLTDAQLVTLADQGAFSADVPKATDLTQGDVYVYYYIQGAEPTEGERTDANTCSDSDIKALTVTLDAAPLWNAEFDLTDAPEEDKAPGVWTTDIPEDGVAKGTEVTVTYTGTKKIIGVKAEKAPDTYLKWDADQKKLVAAEFPAEVTTVVNADGNVTWSAGTYVVEGDVTINGIITLNGAVDLIIKDGAKLTANQIKGSNSNYNLSIYGQANQTGQLFVNCTFGNAIKNMATFEVHSCQVTATSSYDSGGGFNSISTFNVYGGSVDAEYTGNKHGYGISLPGNGSMNIYGGDVKAVGKGNNGNYSYGIRTSNSATVTVYGGKLWAESAGKEALHSNITLTKGVGFTGKIETSGDGSSWTEYTTTGTPETKYVRVGY